MLPRQVVHSAWSSSAPVDADVDNVMAASNSTNNNEPNNNNDTAPSSTPSSPSVVIANNNHNKGNNSNNNRNSSSYSSNTLKGMLRKTTRKTYSALRGGGNTGGSRKHRRRTIGRMQVGEGEDDDSSSSDSIAAENVALQFTAGGGGAAGSGGGARQRSPFVPRGRATGGATANTVEPSRSFYFSPLNSWHDHGGNGAGIETADAPSGGGGGAQRTWSFGGARQQQQQQQHQVSDGNNNDDSMEHIVRGVERALRQVVLCCGMFVAGAAMSDRAGAAYHVLELALAAWGTCLWIAGAGWYRGYREDKQRRIRQHRGQMRETARTAVRQPNNDDAIVATSFGRSISTTPLTNNRSRLSSTTITAAAHAPPMVERLLLPTDENFGITDAEEIFVTSSSPDETTELSPSSSARRCEAEFRKKRSHDELIDPSLDSKPPSPKVMQEIDGAVQYQQRQRSSPTTVTAAAKRHGRQEQQQHSHLENLYVMCKNERILPNEMPTRIDSDLFSGTMLLMFRTPEADNVVEPPPSCDNNTSNDDNTPVNDIANYFRGKQRRFEFQWQLQLKEVPRGEMFLKCVLDEPVRMGMIQRALANGALKFVKKMNQGFSYYISDSSETCSYLSFPVGTSMDRFTATRVGEQPLPVLGQEVVEDPETMKERKKGKKIEWSTDYVYTMSLWSAYCDWIDWQIMNFPGIRPFSITSVAGVQPIKLLLSCGSDDDDAATENIPSQDIVLAMEVSNGTKSTLGSEARQWVATKESEEVTKALELRSEMEYNGNEIFDEEEEEEDEQYDEDDDDDKPMYGEDLEGEEEEGDALQLDNFGCYLLSGTPLSLREGIGNYVASGGGYAVLQSSPTSSIVLEKFQVKKKRETLLGASMMIRSGDVVRVKLIDTTSKAVRFLSVHRGWWLKWNSVRPKKNGLFYIRTAEPNGGLIVLGSPFSLVSRRWSNYFIGACSTSSTKFGGRLLGIYKMGKKSLDDETCDGEEDDGPMQENELDDKDFPVEKSQDKRMLPLLLCAEAYHSVEADYVPPARPTSLDDDVAISVPGPSGSEQVQKRYEIDVPVWLETINRTKRTKQLVYAVRVKETVLTQNEIEPGLSDEVVTSRMFVKLRTGLDLTPILRLGIDYKPELSPSSSGQWQQRFELNNQEELNDADSFTSSSDDSDSDEELDDDESSHFLIAGPNHTMNETFVSDEGNYTTAFPDGKDNGTEAEATPAQHKLTTNSAMDQEYSAIDNEKPGVKAKRSSNTKHSSEKMKREQSCDSDDAEELSRRDSSMSASYKKRYTRGSSQDLSRVSMESKKKSRVKHAAVIGRVAKTVKSSTVVTGKHVIKHSKNIGKGTVKGTVSAGRAAGRVIPASVQYYKPPRRHEPGGVVHRKRQDEDKRQIKILRKLVDSEGQGNFSTSLLSGQLLAPDQSCRKLSQILFNISVAPNNTAQDAISMLAKTTSIQDKTFLRGSSAELGVKPLKHVDPKVDLSTVVARCIYEGHWREELCVLYTRESQHIAFYAPLSKKPRLVISLEEILSARKCEMDTEQSPLPGLYTLAIDAAWKCHYLAFLEESHRDNFLERLNDALFYLYNESHPNQAPKVAQDFERYRMSLENVLTGEAGKWCAVSTGTKSKQKKQRRILNGRRMAFDLIPVTAEVLGEGDAQKKIASYVENLLKMALSFSPDTVLDASDTRFIEFLDQTSRLRMLPLHDIDRDSKDALCIFVNLYHCLLQHSLLLALDGLPNKRSVMQFKRSSCYEIGEDVFSLAELECCVIRGKTSRPSHPKPPFVDAPKKSMPYQMMYGLGATDFRINFILVSRNHCSTPPWLLHLT